MYVHSVDFIYSGLRLDNVSNGVVSNVTVSNNGYGIYAQLSANIVISTSEICNNGEGIHIWLSTNTTIIGNNISSNFGPGLTVRLSHVTTVSANNIHANSWAGVFLDSSDNTTITANNISTNLDGIHLWSSNGTTIITNEISSNDNYGTIIRTSTNSTIVNNRLAGDGILLGGESIIHYNSHVISADNLVNDLPLYYYKDCDSLSLDNIPLGQLITANCTNVYVSNLEIRNADVGIEMAFAKKATIRGCSISENLYGVLLDSSIDVTVYHNDFTNNTENAFDNMGLENSWDSGYPTGGNYWSDHVDVDEFSGPNQDEPGNDGIVDTPYAIDGNSTDRYPLTSPGTIQQSSPRNVTAVLTGQYLENVTVGWDTSTDELTGLVQRYDIYRGKRHSLDGSLYERIGSTPNGTDSYVDAFAGNGNASTFYYMVCSVNIGNTTACADNQAGKFTRPLEKGPQLISIPLIQANEAIETVLQTVGYDKAWYYDSSPQEWKWFMKSKGYRRGLWDVNHTIGLWVNVTQGSNLTVAGIVPAQTMIRVFEGWNLVSFPSFNTSYSVLDLKAEIRATKVEGYDLALPYLLRVLGDAEVLQTGYGYWVRVEADTIWTIKIM